MDLSFVVTDPLDGEAFTVQRSQGGFYGAGGWSDNYVTLNYFGIISIESPRVDDDQPSATRTHETIVINCELPLYVTRLSSQDEGSTSDLVVWHGGNYRVTATHDYSPRGYWWATAERMLGA